MAVMEVDKDDSSHQIEWEANSIAESDIETAENGRVEAFKRIQESYSFLNQETVRLIATLDEAITFASLPEVHFLRFRVVEFHNSIDLRDIIRLMQVPFITFIVLFWVSFVTVLIPNVSTIPPLIITLVVYLSSIPTFKEIFDEYHDKILSGLDVVSKQVDPTFDEFEHKATSHVTLSDDRLQHFLKFANKDLIALQDTRVLVDKVNPGFTVRDISDLDNCLKGREQNLSGTILAAKVALDLEHFGSWALTSKTNFRVAVSLPVLLLGLGMQYFSTSIAVIAMQNSEYKWTPLIVSIMSFALVLLQIFASFYMTSDKKVNKFINEKIKWLEVESNKSLASKASDAFHEVLDVSMQYVRKRVLEIAYYIHEIERIAVGLQQEDEYMEEDSCIGPRSSMAVSMVEDTALVLEDTIREFTYIESITASKWLRNADVICHTEI